MASGNAWLGMDFDPPKFVKIGVYLFQHLGVLGVIVMVFFGWLPSPMLDTHMQIKNQQEATHQYLRANGALIIENIRQGDEIVYLLRRACVNSATNEEAERDCMRQNQHIRNQSNQGRIVK